jgi:hypothetical protein
LIILAAILVPAGLGFIGYGIYDYANGSGDAASEGAQLAASIFAVVFGLAMLVIGVIALLRAYPPRARGYTIAADPAELRRGEDLDVRVSVADPERLESGAELGLVCVEYYSVTRHSENSTYRDDAEATAYEDWRPIRPGQVRPYERFQVPADAPYSHEGEYLSYNWSVRVREPRAMRPDARVDQPIWVSP